MVRYSDRFAATLRSLMGDQGQAPLARQVGCNRATLNRMVKQGRVPSREMLAKVADALEARGVVRAELFAAAGYVEVAS